MKNLLELGKELVSEMKNQYCDSFYKYVDENSLPDNTYVLIGEKLFEDKKMFMDYMNHKYLTDFNWLESKVNSFDFIQDLVDQKLEDSRKYYWHEEESIFIPIIEYPESLTTKNRESLVVPCIIRNTVINKNIYLNRYDNVYCDYKEGYIVRNMDDENQSEIFLEDGVDNIYEYLEEELKLPTIELNGSLNLYFEINSNRWRAKDKDINILDKETGEVKEANDVFISCLDELVESNPDILKKYGLNQILSNVHEVTVQEV